MIKLENYEVVGWEHAIRGMRNPMNSWEKSDSYPAVDCKKCGVVERDGICIPKDHPECDDFRCYALGPNDLSLMKKLRNAGMDHRKFMRMITVYVDITAPLYWWKEFDTYKVGTVANSCSTMHKIADKRFEMSDFSYEHLLPMSAHYLDMTIEALNKCRDLYLGFDGFKHEFGEADKKEYWWQMIQLLPSSYNQKRTIMLNYEVLANMYKSRKAHKLDEWREFCKWIEQLPYAELITSEAVNGVSCVGEPKDEKEADTIKHAYWKQNETNEGYICSSCRCFFDAYYGFDAEYRCLYCPTCGAKMDAKKDDEND